MGLPVANLVLGDQATGLCFKPIDKVESQPACFLSFLKIIYLFFGHAGSSLLRGLLYSCSEWGLPFLAGRGLLMAVACLVVEHGLWGTQASVVVACGLSSWAPEHRLNGCGTQA